MAEGFLKSFDRDLVVFSAGISPSLYVQPNAVKVMKELKIDISDNFTKDVNFFIHKSFDYVISICKIPENRFPVFTGNIGERIYFEFEDSSLIEGMPYEIYDRIKELRDEIKTALFQFYSQNIFNVEKNIYKIKSLI